MDQTVRRLKINKTLVGKPCAVCGDAFMLGEGGAVCEACESPHHPHCWDEHKGCGNKICVNAPPTELPPEGPRLRADEKLCPYCQKIIYIEATICRHCKQVVSGDGIYHGPKTTVGEAKLSLYYGLAALIFTCLSPVLGPLAINEGWEARKRIKNDVQLGGKGLAIAGQIMGSSAYYSSR